MATVIPEHLPTRATIGEKRIHSILRRLPDDWIAYWEPDIGGCCPDFVVVAPGLGVLVIEDKCWYPRTILEGDRNSILIATRQDSKRVNHPARQVREYFHRFVSTVEQQPYGKRFVRSSGPSKGKLNFPVSHIVTLSNISSTQLNDPQRIFLAPLFDSDRTVTRDQLDKWTTLPEAELVSAIRVLFEPFKAIPAFTDDEIKALRMIINPQVDLDAQFRTEDLLSAPRPIDDQQDVLAVFDQRQEKCAMNVGEGHRILFGVAGSGKTLILLTRARVLAKQNPDAEILLTCYNKALAVWMAQHLEAYPNITVKTFHGWGCRNGIAFSKDSAQYGETFLKSLVEGRGDAGRFDAVLVDEAQDFEPSWFKCVLASMKDSENGDLLIVADGAQSLYSRSRISWKELGIKAQGRTHSQRFDLDRNYRNSTEILSLAETFATRTEMQAGPDEDDSIRAVRVDPRLCHRGTGASPLLFIRSSWEDEVDATVGIVKRMLEGRWSDRSMAPLQPEEIAILYPGASTAQKQMLEELPEKILSSCGVGAAWDEVMSGDKANRVQIRTIHSSKGLQYRAVVILWAGFRPNQDRDVTKEAAEIVDRRLLYVGMTRAESFLAMTSSGYSPYIVDIENSPACTVIHRTAESQPQPQPLELAG